MYGKLASTLLAGCVALAMTGAAFANKININTADMETLASGISGVGPAIAERIVQWREQFGPFESVEQIVEVSGIGEKILENNRANLTVEGSSE